MGQQLATSGERRRDAGYYSGCCSCSSSRLQEVEEEEVFESEEGFGKKRPSFKRSPSRYVQKLNPARYGQVGVLTWNVAGVNNNPFEYWVTVEDTIPHYTPLMRAVEEVLMKPEACGPARSNLDLPVKSIFTEEMWQNLRDRMQVLGWSHLDEVENRWHQDISSRRSISGFLLDKDLGKKRFVSMPDRFTNTIRVIPKNPLPAAPPLEPVYRPAVTNNYGGDLSSVDTWWEDWQDFMFQRWMRIQTSDGPALRRPCDMLEKIKASRYPAVTASEEEMSVPLQLLCQAIFDAILVHLMNTITPDGAWLAVKNVLVDRLFRRKHTTTAEILCSYAETEVICLQETAATFGHYLAMTKLQKTHNVVVPGRFSGKRDQNSVVLLSKLAFSDVIEVTDKIIQNFPSPEAAPTDGDILAVSAKHLETRVLYCIVSFHADTDGVLTLPFLEAVHATKKSSASGLAGHRFLLALDANVYLEGTQDQLKLTRFMEWLKEHGMTTCWGDDLNFDHCVTTCHARTFLQPQFQKGIKFTDRINKSDRNPKDLIVFYKNEFSSVQQPHKDNTGQGVFLESTLLPSLRFPSDHGIVATVLSASPQKTMMIRDL